MTDLACVVLLLTYGRRTFLAFTCLRCTRLEGANPRITSIVGSAILFVIRNDYVYYVVILVMVYLIDADVDLYMVWNMPWSI